MTAGLEMPKASTESVAQEILEGISTGAEEIYPDAFAKSIRQGLAADPKKVERELSTC